MRWYITVVLFCISYYLAMVSKFLLHLAHRKEQVFPPSLSSCRAQAWCPQSTWSIPGPGMMTEIPTLSGGFLCTGLSVCLYIFEMYIYVNWNVFLYSVVLDSVGQLHQSAIGIFIPALSWTSLPGSPSPPSSHHRAPRWALCAIEQGPTCYLFYTLWWVYIEALLSIGPTLILPLCPQV